MAATMTEPQSRDWQFALALSREARADPGSPYAGKDVAVLHEAVVATSNNLDEMHAALTSLGIDTRQVTVIEASCDYEQTYMIWEWWGLKEPVDAENDMAGAS